MSRAARPTFLRPAGSAVAADPGAAARRAADEAAADEARTRLRAEGIVPIEPDERIAAMLGPGERLVAVRRGVCLERRADLPRGSGLLGDLYVTTDRLVHLGRLTAEFAVADIREAVVADDLLRLVVGDRNGVEIAVADPRHLRVEIAAIREAGRGTTPMAVQADAPDDARAGEPPSGQAPSL